MANMRDISFATFNLYNLNLPEEPIYGQAGWTQAQYEAKIAWTAARLKETDADVIGFQECWRSEALQACFAKAGLDQTYDLVTRNVTPPASRLRSPPKRDFLPVRANGSTHFPPTAATSASKRRVMRRRRSTSRSQNSRGRC